MHGCFLRPVWMILDRGSPPHIAADPRSSMGPRLVPGPGRYSGCHVTRSNSLPSGSANVVWRTAATPGGSAAGGRLISVSGLAPRAVSRSVSSSWWSVTRTGWTLFLAVPGLGGLWRIILGPASGPVASTAVSPATAPGLTGRPRALPQKSARAAGSAASMVRAAKLRSTVVVMMVSFRWVDSPTAAPGVWHQRLWRISRGRGPHLSRRTGSGSFRWSPGWGWLSVLWSSLSLLRVGGHFPDTELLDEQQAVGVTP